MKQTATHTDPRLLTHEQLRHTLRQIAREPAPNPWFQARIMHRLPPRRAPQPGRGVMLVLTILAIAACLPALASVTCLPATYSPALLCAIYAALAAVIVLLVAHIVRCLTHYLS